MRFYRKTASYIYFLLNKLVKKFKPDVIFLRNVKLLKLKFVLPNQQQQHYKGSQQWATCAECHRKPIVLANFTKDRVYKNAVIQIHGTRQSPYDFQVTLRGYTSIFAYLNAHQCFVQRLLGTRMRQNCFRPVFVKQVCTLIMVANMLTLFEILNRKLNRSTTKPTK